MMTDVLFIVPAVTIAFSLAILVVSLVIAVNISRAADSPRNEGYLPKAAVVLSIRGADPFLPRLLEDLANLDYPDYHVRVVVDHADDPEWEILREAATRRPARFVTMTLTDPATTCGLKNSALIQAVESADPDVEVFAFVDADAHIYPGWLRDLVAPLRDPQAGASSGFRWYMPVRGELPSLVRYYWNAAAFGLMWLFRIAWGGSMALKRSALERTLLPEVWRHCLADDTPIHPTLRTHGLSQEPAPQVIVVNRERIRLRGFVSWGSRQALGSRLYSPSWPLILLYIGLQAGWRIPTIAVILLLASAGNDLWLVFAAVEAFYWSSMFAAAGAIEAAVRKILRRRNEPATWLTPGTILKLPIALVLAHLILLYQAVAVVLMRRVHWRGIEYQITPGKRIVMKGYHRFATQPGNREDSIL